MDEKNEILNVSKINYKEDSNRYKQSANSLFNFMRKIDYLKKILSNKAFIPRYYEEIIDYLGMDNVEKIVFPMTCFCDIHVQKIKYHCYDYGNIGIGMSKKWGVSKGIQSIHYINNNSRIYKELSRLFVKEDSPENETIIEEYKNYILEHILFIKPLVGKMYIRGEYTEKNFHDEKEWRYIPKINNDIDIPLILPQEYSNISAYHIFSEAINRYEELWLKFEYDDIKYLFLENEEDRQDIIDYIINDLDIEENEKYKLISKIIVLDQIKEDM